MPARMQQQIHPVLSQAFALYSAGRVQEAIQIIRQLAAAGEPDALFAFADVHWRGVGVPQDLGRAWQLFERASDAGQPMAIRAFTNLLASGIAGPRDWQRAMARLEAEARADTRRAQMLALIRAMDLTPSGDPARLTKGEMLSERPYVMLFRGAFSAGECDFLQLIAEPIYERSVVVTDGQDVVDPVRTSDGSTIHWLIEDPAIHAMNRRLAALTGTAVEQGEPLQILRYAPGQQYRPHYDWLGEGNRRVMTALVYLNDDYAGGETAFLRTGLNVRARKGDALVFRSATPEGELDPLSEHAGLPVTSGTKYLASRWIREHRHTP